MERIEEVLKKLKEEAKENFVPIVRDNTINKIVSLLNKKKCKDILEIGTAIGYSGIIMLLQNDKSFLTTIEKNEKRYKEAQQNFLKTGLNDRTTLILGDALEEIAKLKVKGQKFDFIFLDGPKGQYIKYLPYLKTLLKGGGILFADNILLGGLLKDQKKVTHKNRTMFNNMKAFLSDIQKDNDFETTLYDIDDGFLIAILKKSAD